MMAGVIDMFIDLVAQYNHVLVSAQYLCQLFQFLLAVDGAGRVAGRAKNQCAGAGSDGSFQLRGGNFEILFNGSFDIDRFAVGHQYHLRIAYPVRSRD